VRRSWLVLNVKQSFSFPFIISKRYNCYQDRNTKDFSFKKVQLYFKCSVFIIIIIIITITIHY